MATGWGPPLMDFSIIGNLPQDYYAGQERARQDALRQAFQGGLPRTASGDIDWNAVVNTVARTGNLGSIQSLNQILPLSQENEARGIGASVPGLLAPPMPGAGAPRAPVANPVNPFGQVPGGTEGYVNPGFRADALPPGYTSGGEGMPPRREVASSPTVIGDREGEALGIYEPTRLAYGPTNPNIASDIPMVGAAPGGAGMRYAQAGGGAAGAAPPAGQVQGGVQPGATPVTTVPIRGQPTAPPAPSATTSFPAMPGPIDPSRIPAIVNALRSRRLSEGQRQALLKALEHYYKQTDPSSLPTEVREFMFGQANPDFFAKQLELRRAGATAVNTAEGAEAIATRERYQSDRPMVQAAVTRAEQSLQQMPVVGQLIDLADKVPAGLLGQYAPQINKLLSPFGITWEGGDHASLYQALGRQMVPAVREPGATSNFEQQMYIEAIPALSQSPAGRRLLGEMLKAQMSRSVRLAEAARKYQGKDELFDRMRDVDNAATIPPKLRLQVINERRTVERRPTVPSGTAVILTDAEFDALKPGTVFVDPNGDLRKKP